MAAPKACTACRSVQSTRPAAPDWPGPEPWTPGWQVRFLTKLYHPNVDKLGRICLDILKDKWSPALQIRTVLLRRAPPPAPRRLRRGGLQGRCRADAARPGCSIQALLSAPNPDDPLSENVAKHWKENEKEAVATGAPAPAGHEAGGCTCPARQAAGHACLEVPAAGPWAPLVHCACSGCPAYPARPCASGPGELTGSAKCSQGVDAIVRPAMRRPGPPAPRTAGPATMPGGAAQCACYGPHAGAGSRAHARPGQPACTVSR